MNKQEKFIFTINYLNDLLCKNKIEKFIFIKDFKKGVASYCGSNVDVYIKNTEDILKIKQALERDGFRKEFFSFEFDKLMFFPPSSSERLTKIHIYPYIGWYTLRFNYLKDDLSHHVIKKNGINIFTDLAEVPLILFHGFFEDRKIARHDLIHLREIIKENSFTRDNFEKIIDKYYWHKFSELYELVMVCKEPEIRFSGFLSLFVFIMGTENKLKNKSYFLIIQTLKLLKIIRG